MRQVLGSYSRESRLQNYPSQPCYSFDGERIISAFLLVDAREGNVVIVMTCIMSNPSVGVDSFRFACQCSGVQHRSAAGFLCVGVGVGVGALCVYFSVILNFVEVDSGDRESREE